MSRLNIAPLAVSGKLILNVGIEENGTSRYEFNILPQSHIVLPHEITETYQSFLNALVHAVRTGDAKEIVDNHRTQ